MKKHVKIGIALALWAAIWTSAFASTTNYSPIGLSPSSPSQIEAMVDAIEKDYKQELVHVYNRVKRNNMMLISSVETFPEFLLDTGGSSEGELEDTTPKTIYEADLIAEYGERVEEYDLPLLAQDYVANHSSTILWVYSANGIYTVLLESGVILQYGHNGVFLTINSLFEGEIEFIRDESSLFGELLDTGAGDDADLDYEALFGAAIWSVELPPLARYDVSTYATSIDGIYYQGWVYTVVLEDGTILQYGKNWVFYTIESM